MAGGYVICEWASVREEFPDFQRTLKALEDALIAKCNADWSPKSCGFLTPKANQWGRTTILPALFKDNTGTQMATWRQHFASSGHQLVIAGARTGNVIPEDFKVGWVGLAFPNPVQHISEIRFQIGDRKYGRIDLEELKSYRCPALIFEDGFIIDEEQAFELYGYVDTADVYQRVVMLGFCCFKVIDKVLGNPGSAI